MALAGRSRAPGRLSVVAPVVLLVCGCSTAATAPASLDATTRSPDAAADSGPGDDDASADDAYDYVVPDALPIFIDPLQGAIGCDAAFRGAFGCAGEILLHGAINDAFVPQTCAGMAGSPVLTFGGAGRDGAQLQLVVTFASSIVAGVAGVQPAATVSLASTGGDAASGSWTTPTGACSVTFDGNVCLPGVLTHAYAVSGTGSCSAAAAPASGNPAGSVTIPGFSFSARLLMPSVDGG